MNDNKLITFTLGGMVFEYDEYKNKINVQKHGISFKSAARKGSKGIKQTKVLES